MSQEPTDLISRETRQDAGATTAQPPRVPWYRQAFQADYLDLYIHRDLAEAAHAVRFLSTTLGLNGTQRLLDLCCGPGRHLVFLGKYVRQAVGLDLSRVLLERAREHWRATHNPQLTTHNAQLIQADMRRLPLAQASFDCVVNLFTSFGYFEREEDNAAVLTEIGRVLRPGGLLALDHINREAMLAHLRPRTERGLPDGRIVVEKRHWDGPARRVIKDVTCREPGGQVKGWSESVRVYEPAELEAMMDAAGLEPAARHGDYDGGPWRPDGPRLIIIARRKALKDQSDPKGFIPHSLP